jgi:hypothetical protein
MALAEGTANLMQRLARLPAPPHLDPLLSGKPVPFSLCHKHHLLKMNSYQMVLHRPVETARIFGNYADGCRAVLKTDNLRNGAGLPHLNRIWLALLPDLSTSVATS